MVGFSFNILLGARHVFASENSPCRSTLPCLVTLAASFLNPLGGRAGW